MGNFGFVFSIFPILFAIVFVLILGVFIVSFAKGISQWSKNNHSPRLTVEATVVAKRTNYHRHSGTKHTMAHTTSTYFVTFQVQSGDRMELQMNGSEYGLLIEGDFGDLTFQGTRYLAFQRKAKTYDI